MIPMPADPTLALTPTGMELSTVRVWPKAVCAGGQPSTGARAIGWLGQDHCWHCYGKVQQSLAAFRAGVAAGKWDDRGYTPAERKRLARRRT